MASCRFGSLICWIGRRPSHWMNRRLRKRKTADQGRLNERQRRLGRGSEQLMDHFQECVTQFFQAWTAELAGAIEMFTGEPPVVTYAIHEASAGHLGDDRLDQYLWWKQTFEAEVPFRA